MMERLDKFIAGRTEFSRNDVKMLLKRGRVTVNGNTVSDAGLKIDPGKDSVTADGHELVWRKNTYICLNKPDGYVCSTRDGRSETVLSLVPEDLMNKDIFPAGRLDKDSKGFVFLTDDGGLAHRMLSPKKHLTKCYLVRLAEKYSEEYEKAFESGLAIDCGDVCMPARVCGVSHDDHFALVGLDEGKFHQVKRMFHALGNEVVSLFRVSIGGLVIKPDLAPGECLEILDNEIEKMLSEFDFSDVLKFVETSFYLLLTNNDL
ncbi:pseudouridine synthase [Ruminococcus sp. HUN007]|uniref:pseudouridine synthase n=1 Tax=Ruminococcus sp. HUN007 TaxID=1514668 RepID=UPI0006794DA0|nr:pseudouridine synthase [Ruminococcus sp. HUN007]